MYYINTCGGEGVDNRLVSVTRKGFTTAFLDNPQIVTNVECLSNTKIVI